jgi:hypothetical protein
LKSRSSRSTRLLAIAAAALGFAASSAAAAETMCKAIKVSPEARLVTVAGETNVLFTGRGRLSEPLEIAGMTIDAGRGRSWRARVPLAELRRNAAPFARRVTVEARCRSLGTQPVTVAQQVRLPIGLLGWNTQLASIELSMR